MRELCKTKDSRIKELEDVINKTIKLTPANQLAEEKDNKTNQFQKESGERITSASNQNEATRYVSHIPMNFEHLRTDMLAVSKNTRGTGEVYLKVSVNLGTRKIEIEFCGITEQKDVTMTSSGIGELKEA
jgi:hypothetical protein